MRQLVREASLWLNCEQQHLSLERNHLVCNLKQQPISVCLCVCVRQNIHFKLLFCFSSGVVVWVTLDFFTTHTSISVLTQITSCVLFWTLLDWNTTTALILAPPLQRMTSSDIHIKFNDCVCCFLFVCFFPKKQKQTFFTKWEKKWTMAIIQTNQNTFLAVFSFLTKKLLA